MSYPRVSYAPRPDSTPKAETDALTSLYSLAIRRYEENAAGVTSTNGGEPKGSLKHDRPADPSIS